MILKNVGHPWIVVGHQIIVAKINKNKTQELTQDMLCRQEKNKRPSFFQTQFCYVIKQDFPSGQCPTV